MANTLIQIKRSTTTATPSSLNVGELAYSYTSNIAFIGTSDNTGALPIGGQFYVERTNTALVAANAALANTTGTFAGTLTVANDLIVTGNATFDTNTMYVDAINNRVGIGTAAPLFRLQSNGTIASYSSDGTNYGTLGSTSISLGQNNSFRSVISHSGNESLHFTPYNQLVLALSASDFTPSVQLTSSRTFGWSSTNGQSNSPDLVFHRDVANTLGQRNGTAGQTYRLYGTFTDTSNYERLSISANASGSFIQTQHAGTGTARSLNLGANNTTLFQIQPAAKPIRMSSGSIAGTSGTGFYHLDNTSFAFGQDAGSGVWGGIYYDGFVVSSEKFYGFGSSGTASPDTLLYRDGASGRLAQRNSSAAQSYRLYGTYTDASNYERINLTANTTGHYIIGEEGGTGAARPLYLGSNNAIAVTIESNNTVRTSSTLTSGGSIGIGGQAVTSAGWEYNNPADMSIYSNSSKMIGIHGGSGFVLFRNAIALSSTANYNTQDVILARDAANILAQRNGTANQTYRLYGTYTDTSNYERINITANTTGHYIIGEEAGTGSGRPLYLGSNNRINMTIDTSGNVGIGVTAPSSILDVNGKITTRFGGALRGYFGSPSWDSSYVAIQHGSLGESSSNAAIHQSSVGDTTLNAAIGRSVLLKINNDAGGQGQLAFTSKNFAFTGANVGIGIATATSNLHVIGTANVTSNLVVQGVDVLSSITGANNYANSTYVKLSAASQTITGDLTVVGNLSLSGNTTFSNAQTLIVNDPLIYLAGNNYTSDIIDIGFIANYVNATGSNVHTGLYREHEDKMYYLFQGYDREPINNHIGALSNNMTLAVLNADLRTSNLTLGGTNTITWITSSFAKANAALANTSGIWFNGNLTIGSATSDVYLGDTIVYANLGSAVSNSNSGFVINQTWNNAGQIFTGLTINVNSTAASASSYLLDVKQNNASAFYVRRYTGIQGEIGINSNGGIWNLRVVGNEVNLIGTSGNHNVKLPGANFLRSAVGYGFELGSSSGSVLYSGAQEAANTLAQRNGTAAQAYRLYGTYTDASNYERINLTANTTGHYIIGEKGGTGSARPLYLGSNNAIAATIDDQGRVGIGTTSPTSPLHVAGATFPVARIERTTSLTTGSRSSFASIHKTTGDMTDGFGTDFSFIIRDSSNVDNEIAQFGAWRDGADNSGTLFFSTINAGVFEYPKMFIKPNGRVGIGTFTPTAKLTLANGTSATSQHIYGTYTDASNYERINITANSSGHYIIGEEAGTGSARPLYLGSNNAIAATITDQGRVGIGTTNPLATLQVNGSILLANSSGVGLNTLLINPKNISNFSVIGTYPAEGTNINSTLWVVPKGTGVANNKAQINVFKTDFVADSTNYEFAGLRARDFDFFFATGKNGTGITRPLVFSAGGLNGPPINENQFVVDTTGNVGVGTSSPAYKLEVAGSFAAQTKSFIINHQSKPNHRLRYGSLEGPENGVYVRGKSTSNVIELPDYWTWLVDEDTITVNITPIGKKQTLFVEKIENNKVYIKNDAWFSSDVNYFYTVYGERKDVDKLIAEIPNP
jgi:hypothetical protein